MRFSGVQWLLLTAFCMTSSLASFTPIALQSGPDSTGASYASGMAYDAADHTVTITGATFGRVWEEDGPDPHGYGACFFATLQLPTGDEPVEWLHSEKSDSYRVTESCSSVMMHHDNHLFALGHTGIGGLLEDIRWKGSPIATQEHGMVLDLVQDATTKQTKIVGGRVLQESVVVYPVDMTSSPSDDYIYVVTMETNSHKKDDSQDGIGDLFLDPNAILEYGEGWTMNVERHLVQDAATDSTYTTQTLREDWRETFATDEGDNIHVSGIAKVNDDTLVVVGSTTGWGQGFGDLSIDMEGMNDLDGFVTKIDAKTGVLLESAAPSRASARIESLNKRDDWVNGICHSPKDPNHFYIVGATQGNLGGKGANGATANPSIQAFLQKLKTSTLLPEWTIQLGADTPENNATVVRGYSCAITPDGSSVYMAGSLDDGAVLPLSGEDKSAGGRDVFVANYDTQTGERNWVRQVGSNRDDNIARRQGVTTDVDGNAIVLGNTVGSVYRERDDSENPFYGDIFLLTLDRTNGAMVVPSHFAKGGSSSNRVDSGTPPVNTVSSSSGMEKWAGLLLLLFVLSGLAFFAANFVARRYHTEVLTERTKVLEYLGDFDVEDIDLKHSATGGWHCNYANDLASGVNRGPADNNGLMTATSLTALSDPLTAPLNEPSSRILEDSLFMDEDEPPRLGGPPDLLGRPQQRADSATHGGYSDLVDAYNSSWEDRSSSTSSSSKGRTGKSQPWGREII